MTKHPVIISCVCALLLALPASPVRAVMSVVSDAELAAISASSNDYSVTPSGCDECGSSLTQTSSGSGSGSDGNILVGYVQWDDDHSTDQSNHKGANDLSGANSQVQTSVTATVNAIQWGVMANSVMVVTDLTASGGLVLESHATMFLGGF
jgi:hypothetical protein